MSAGDRYLTLYLADFDFEKREKILGSHHLFTNGIQIPVALGSHNTAAELEEFVDIILNDKPVSVSAREGADTVAVCVAAVESSMTGMPKKVDKKITVCILKKGCQTVIFIYQRIRKYAGSEVVFPCSFL